MNKKKFTNTESLIASFLLGKATKEETEELISWIRKSEKNRNHFLQTKNLWDSSTELPVSTDKALLKVLQQIETGNSFAFWKFWQKAAAVLFLPLLAALIWISVDKVMQHRIMDSRRIAVTAPYGTFASFKLPDGSKIWLNAGSHFEYPGTFKRKKRSVWLTGEAYFEVKSDVNSPFTVNTPYFSVRATGTCFNVTTYPGDTHPSVSLVKGSVCVFSTDNNGNRIPISSLKPHQHVVYNTLTGKATTTDEDTYKHIAWKDGKLVFRNDLLTEVVDKISRLYNIDIQVMGDSVKQYRFRASFENEPLNELLRLLKLSSPIDYYEIEPKPLPDGTFSKRKIIIFSSKK
jgi:transmembrane sensor